MLHNKRSSLVLFLLSSLRCGNWVKKRAFEGRGSQAMKGFETDSLTEKRMQTREQIGSAFIQGSDSRIVCK